MSRIKIVSLENARGVLRQEYDKAQARAGRIWHIVSLMSQNPRALKASMEFYSALMHGRSPLSRGQREMLATVVSSTNRCVY